MTGQDLRVIAFNPGVRRRRRKGEQVTDVEEQRLLQCYRIIRKRSELVARSIMNVVEKYAGLRETPDR